MSKTIDFSFTGGFRLTSDILEILQGQTAQLKEYVLRNVPKTGIYILFGVKRTNDSYSDGFLCVNGDLVPFFGGVGDYYELGTTSESRAYEDGNTYNDITETIAVVSNISSLPRVDSIPRFSQNQIVTWEQCTNLFDIFYRYTLPAGTTSINLQLATAPLGFVLSRIDPFDGILPGHTLLVKIGANTGLSWATFSGVDSNINFQRQDRASNFIGTNNSSLATWYDVNRFVQLMWDGQRWLETHRGSHMYA